MMTVQDFIVIYNETFRYIHEKYGREKVDELWATISSKWCQHLRELVCEKGIEGAYEYWGGEGGTLSREEAGFEIEKGDDTLTINMYKCPSVQELKDRGREIYIDYCDHCQPLYDPVLRDYGLRMTVSYERDSEGLPTGSCQCIIDKT